MSHSQQMAFLESLRHTPWKAAYRAESVLEIGSLDVNGSVRRFWHGVPNYVGVDLLAGKGVDVVCPAENLPYGERLFDVVVSCECLEHARNWSLIFERMWRISRRYVIMTCASVGREEHGTTACHAWASPATNDYYRNLTALDFEREHELPVMFRRYEWRCDGEIGDLYFVGLKR